jgi:hypothetical protein
MERIWVVAEVAQDPDTLKKRIGKAADCRINPHIHVYYKDEKCIHNFFRNLNVTAEWLALLLHIRDVMGSNMSTEKVLPTVVLVVFLSPSKCRDNTSY